MKRRNKKSLLDIKIVSDLLFVLLGLAIMMLLMIIFSVLVTKMGIIYQLMVILAEISLCTGCFISGFCYALFKRKKGLFNGVINSVRIYAVIFIIGLIVMDSISISLIPLRFAGAVLSGAIGGIYGVNSKLKKPI